MKAWPFPCEHQQKRHQLCDDGFCIFCLLINLCLPTYLFACLRGLFALAGEKRSAILIIEFRSNFRLCNLLFSCVITCFFVPRKFNSNYLAKDEWESWHGKLLVFILERCFLSDKWNLTWDARLWTVRENAFLNFIQKPEKGHSN
jgi:hypothetical protein